MPPEIGSTRAQITGADTVSFELDSSASGISGSCRFKRMELYARGGMGEVHRALDVELGRVVAYKRLQSRFAQDRQSLRRFVIEAEVTARLEHPGIVPVYGLIANDGGSPSYAMRFIQGETLASAIKHYHQSKQKTSSTCKRLELRQLLSRFISVCNTMAYAHEKGYIHRDLKPANIMLGSYGETLVVDWGLAKLVVKEEHASLQTQKSPKLPDADQIETIDTAHLRETSQETSAALQSTLPFDAFNNGNEQEVNEFTEAGTILGTPCYMSPEQALGKWEELNAASDIYSLGATLYELLTGQHPFKGAPDGMDEEAAKDLFVMLERVQHGEFLPPRIINPSIPRALEAVCLKAMARDASTRYASALVLASDLEHWLADEAVQAYREPRYVQFSRWMRRHRTMVSTALVTLILFILGGMVSWHLASKVEEQAAENRYKQIQAAESNERLALVELQANRFSNAVKLLREATQRLNNFPDDDELLQHLNQRLQNAQRIEEFYRLADQGERYIIQNNDRQTIARFTRALEIMRAFDQDQWWLQLPDQELTHRQKDRLVQDIHLRQIVLAGILARVGFLYPGKKEESVRNYQQALQLLKLANSYQPTVAAAGVEYLCHAGQGKFGDIKLLASLKPTLATDHYLLGIGHAYVTELPKNTAFSLLFTIIGKLPYLDLQNSQKKAEEYLRQAVAQAPDHYWSQYWLGRVLDLAGRHADAELAFTSCCSLRNEVMDGHFARVQTLLEEAGKQTGATQEPLLRRILLFANQGIQANPHEYYGYLGRGEVFLHMNRLDEALADFDKGIGLRDKENTGDDIFPVIYKKRARIHELQNRWVLARQDIDMAISLRPEFEEKDGSYAALMYQRSGILKELGEYELALKDVDECLKIRQRVNYFTRIADIRLRQGRAPLANTACDKALKLDAKNIDALWLKAEAAVQLNDYLSVSKHLRQVVDTSQYELGVNELSVIMLQQKDYTGYRNLCQQVWQQYRLHPQNIKLLQSLQILLLHNDTGIQPDTWMIAFNPRSQDGPPLLDEVLEGMIAYRTSKWDLAVNLLSHSMATLGEDKRILVSLILAQTEKRRANIQSAAGYLEQAKKEIRSFNESVAFQKNRRLYLYSMLRNMVMLEETKSLISDSAP